MEGLQHDTLELIQNTAKEADGASGKVEFKTPPGCPPHQVFAIDKHGKWTEVKVEPAPRSHTLVSCEEVPHFVEQQKLDSAAVWFDRTGIVVVVDDETRRDKATLRLSHTPQLLKLISLGQRAQPMDPISFRRMLRVDFAECLPDESLVNWVSNCYFTRDGKTTLKLRHASDGLGTEVRSEAKSETGDCPEFVNVSVRIFDDPSVMTARAIPCAVEIDADPEKPTFTLTPLPLRIHDAIESEVNNIGELLRSTLGESKIFRGTP